VSEQAVTPMQARPTIADILLSHGFVGEEELTAALKVSDRTGQPLGQVLVEAGAITRLELASALAEQWSDPDASITLLPRSFAPPSRSQTAAAPADVDHDVGDDSIYVGRLHDAVADLARRVGEAEPLLAEMERRAAESIGPETLEALDGRISALAEHLEATLGRMTELEGALSTTADEVEGVTEGVEQAFTSLQAGTGELAERLAVIASIVETAPTSSDLTELQAAVAALAARPQADDTVGERLGLVSSELEGALATLAALSATVDELAGRPQLDPSLTDRLENLQALVAELAARPAVAPELAQRLEELAARPQADPALPGRLDELVAHVEAQGSLYDAVAAELRAAIDTAAARPEADGALGARVEELAGRVTELAGQVESLAAVAASGDDGVAIEELRGALEELGRRRAGDEETASRLADLAAVVEDLALRPPGDPALAGRVEELAAATAALTSDTTLSRLTSAVDELVARSDAGDSLLADLCRRLEELEARPVGDPALAAGLEELSDAVATLRDDEALLRLGSDVDAIRSRLEADDATLGELRAAAVELAARPAGDPELAARLATLAARVDELAAESFNARGDDRTEAHVQELGAAVTSLHGVLDAAVARMVARLEALETAVPREPVEGPAADAAWAAEAAKLAERLDALSARLDEGAPGSSAAVPAPAPRPATGPAGSGDETEQELERLRMAIERMSLHLGEQERAIAEVMRSRGVTQRLDELEARIDDVAAGGAGGAAAPEGSAAPATANLEVRALVRRLDTAEAALEAERDKLLTKLERIASSLDWRMRRLEAGDDPSG